MLSVVTVNWNCLPLQQKLVSATGTHPWGTTSCSAKYCVIRSEVRSTTHGWSSGVVLWLWRLATAEKRHGKCSPRCGIVPNIVPHRLSTSQAATHCMSLGFRHGLLFLLWSVIQPWWLQWCCLTTCGFPLFMACTSSRWATTGRKSIPKDSWNVLHMPILT